MSITRPTDAPQAFYPLHTFRSTVLISSVPLPCAFCWSKTTVVLKCRWRAIREEQWCPLSTTAVCQQGVFACLEVWPIRHMASPDTWISFKGKYINNYKPKHIFAYYSARNDQIMQKSSQNGAQVNIPSLFLLGQRELWPRILFHGFDCNGQTCFSLPCPKMHLDS